MVTEVGTGVEGLHPGDAVTRIEGREVRSELQALAGTTLTVAPAGQDVALLHQALRPSDQASAFFAVISALLGFLFALNAILLTVPERREAIADLRLSGTKRSAIVQMVLFQALCLGLAASLIRPGDPWAVVSKPFLWPGVDPRFPLGTDVLGRDLLSGLLHGATVSLTIGFSAAAVAAGAAALNHKIGNYAVKGQAVVIVFLMLLAGSFVGELFGAFGQADEVSDGLGRFLLEQADDNVALRGLKNGVGSCGSAHAISF